MPKTSPKMIVAACAVSGTCRFVCENGAGEADRRALPCRQFRNSSDQQGNGARQKHSPA
jgi:hypothetical protein